MKNRGLTLIEMMVAAGITALISVAISGAYVTAITFTKRSAETHATEDARIRFETRISSLLQLATLTSDTTDQNSYFIGQQGDPQAPTTTGTNGATGGNGTTASTTSSSTSNSDTLVFSINGQRLPGGPLISQDDFETANKDFGPIGGEAEVAFETTPVGNPPADSHGIYLRIQRPGDSDPSEGGTETVLDSDVTQISYEFFDGVDWQPTWNTLTGTRRLPAAVRVAYRLTDDDTDRVFIVQIPTSDVTPDNPIAQGATG